MKFHERQDFYENRSGRIAEIIEEANADKVYAESSEKFLGDASDFFKKFLDEEKARHEADAKSLGDNLNGAQAAVDRTDDAIKAVTDWSPSTNTTFIQEKLDHVAASYLQVKTFKIVVPSSFVQLAASDDQVRQRLLEWLGALRVVFLEAKDHAEAKRDKVAKAIVDIESAVNDLVSTYQGDVKFAHEQVENQTDNLKGLESGAELLKKLVSDNAGLVISNQKYCDVEKENYGKAKDLIDGQLKLFREIRTYFRDNYSKMNTFIKGKYGN